MHQLDIVPACLAATYASPNAKDCRHYGSHRAAEERSPRKQIVGNR